MSMVLVAGLPVVIGWVITWIGFVSVGVAFMIGWLGLAWFSLV